MEISQQQAPVMRMTILLMMNFYDTSSSFAILFVIVMDSLHKATAATFLICCTCISPQMKRKQ